ncbi:hypothetical protein [Georgenia yuyongxinii]
MGDVFEPVPESGSYTLRVAAGDGSPEYAFTYDRARLEDMDWSIQVSVIA